MLCPFRRLRKELSGPSKIILQSEQKGHKKKSEFNLRPGNKSYISKTFTYSSSELIVLKKGVLFQHLIKKLRVKRSGLGKPFGN